MLCVVPLGEVKRAVPNEPRWKLETRKGPQVALFRRVV